MRSRLPSGTLLAFYGDDFTGSTDAMEVMAFAGVKTVLFTKPPTTSDLTAFADYQVVGIAGTARSRSQQWMDENLADEFAKLAALRPAILQYKVCSTFDSSPEVGSIGRAIDIGMRTTGSAWSPSIVGAPQLRRWQVFGNLYAVDQDGRNYRIDRHPTMSRHPVTPMRESDLKVHLARQTARRIEGIDFPNLSPSGFKDRFAKISADHPIIFLDVLDDHSQRMAGSIVWDNREGLLFTASSSGLQYALLSHWRASGLLEETAPSFPRAGQADRILVLSGSCSPATAQQIESAEASGFVGIRLDTMKATDPTTIEAETERIISAGRRALDSGSSVVVYTAKTIDDEAFQRLKSYCALNNVSFSEAQRAIGVALGAIANQLIQICGPVRLIVAGGDTSGQVMSHLPVTALEAAHPFAPGAPFCQTHSDELAFKNLEIILKGGQVSGENLFLDAKNGYLS